MIADIYGEFWRSIQTIKPHHAGQLGKLGFDPVAIDLIGGIGVERVRVERQIWEPDPEGVFAVIVPVWEGPAFDRDISGFRPSPLIDLVAWRPSDPTALPTRLNSATAINSYALYPALAGSQPVSLYRNPASWRGDPDGVVVIDWRGCDALLGKRQIVAEDAEHGDLVKAKLMQLRHRITPKIPPIGILASRMAA